MKCLDDILTGLEADRTERIKTMAQELISAEVERIIAENKQLRAKLAEYETTMGPNARVTFPEPHR